ncbi:hypothetical protein PoB_003092400 [Plakobranchus ocellatus]|uniref:Uncharacterized protein n=1 Tax=Plakobranchus ocellatus TaxID=259542 RepID=A0AAV4ADD5_9GAST|nr:hypothetical protein PoB_003092400 [Plakobranchus ocellatus]
MSSTRLVIAKLLGSDALQVHQASLELPLLDDVSWDPARSCPAASRTVSRTAGADLFPCPSLGRSCKSNGQGSRCPDG